MPAAGDCLICFISAIVNAAFLIGNRPYLKPVNTVNDLYTSPASVAMHLYEF